jgi:hypothetical protein
MRYVILPTTIDGIDEKGNPIKVNIAPDRVRKSIDGTQWICHEELLLPEHKAYVLNAVDLEGTETKESTIEKEKVLKTKAKTLIATADWSIVE